MQMEDQASGLKRSVAEYLAFSECSLAVNSKTSTLHEEIIWTHFNITCEGKWMVRNARSQSPATARHITQSVLSTEVFGKQVQSTCFAVFSKMLHS